MARLNNKKIRELRCNSSNENGDVFLTNDLAKDLELSHNVVRRMETDENYNPGVLTLLRLSEYFNVLIDDLIIKD